MSANRYSRRLMAKQLAAGLLLSLAGCNGSMKEGDYHRKQGAVSFTFVLVHGAWHGGWCWKFVNERLEAAGHTVFTPTLSGLAERSDMMSSDIGLQTHIDDVTSVLENHNLQNIILVGHSYGGMVITGVADAMKNRIQHMVYLDAVLPTNGQSLLTQGQSINAEELKRFEVYMVSQSDDGGISMRAPSAIGFGLKDHQIEMLQWVEEQLTSHPIKTWTDPIKLLNGGGEGLKSTYIYCTNPAMTGASFGYHADRLKGKPNWQVKELSTGHDAMITAPDELTNLLLNLSVN